MTPSVDEIAAKGGDTFTLWFNRIRVILMFALGWALIVLSVLDTQGNTRDVIAGAILMGLVPLDQWIQRLPGSSPTKENSNGHQTTGGAP